MPLSWVQDDLGLAAACFTSAIPGGEMARVLERLYLCDTALSVPVKQMLSVLVAGSNQPRY